MHLLTEYTHILTALPFIPVIFADQFGSCRCQWTDTYQGPMAIGSLEIHLLIYKKRLLHFV